MTRPLPVPDEQSTPYWAAAAEHRLVLARCGRCGRQTHPPTLVCPNCGSSDPAWTFDQVGGTGTVCSWTVLHQSFVPGFDEDVPFVLVDVCLDGVDDVRLIGRLVDGPAATLWVGAPVTLTFEDVAPGVAVPAFTLGSR